MNRTYCLGNNGIDKIDRLSGRLELKKSSAVTEAVELLDQVCDGIASGGRLAMLRPDGTVEILIGVWNRVKRNAPAAQPVGTAA